MTLLTNDLRDRNMIADLVRFACSGNGPFAANYKTLKAGQALKDGKRFVTGSVPLERGKSATVHMIGL